MPDHAPLLTIDGAIACITLRRPAVANRLEVEDLQTLQQQIEQINATLDVRVLLLRAEGRHFCSGFNIGAVPGVDAGALFEAMSNAFEDARPLTVAAIQGGVYGGATDLALACDFRLGLPACEMFVPAVRLGLHFYRGGLQRYVSRLGVNWAKRVLLAGEKLDAQAMLASGFLQRLLPDNAALQEAAVDLCGQLAAMAPLAAQGMKKHLNAIADGRLDSAALQADIARSNASSDLVEGVGAWQAKREPRFKGC